MLMENFSAGSLGKNMRPAMAVTYPVAGNLVWLERVYQGPLGPHLNGVHGTCSACTANSKPLRYRPYDFMKGVISDYIFG